MGKLHELLAVEGDLEGESRKIIEEAKDTFGKRDRFIGSTRSVKMFDDNRSNEEIVEHKAMTTTVTDKLKYTHDAITRYLNAFLQKETTNQRAKASIVVNDVVLAENVPATALLGLETKLKGVRAMYEEIPTLAPGTSWVWDDQVSAYRMEHPDEKLKTEKSLKWQQIAPPTDKHPAQVEKWNADVPVGKIITEETSGMITPAEKSRLLGRIDTLIRAIKQARQRANSEEVVPVEIGEKLISFIHSSGE